MFRKIIKGLKDVWCGTLEFDTEPKKDSFNPVTSGGVYDAINGAGGAKEIVYFDIDPSDPPSGIYAAITEALSKKKEPVLKIDGAVYFYTATGTDKYVFVGGYTKDAVGYTEIEVSDDDSVTSKSVDDKVFNMYMLYRTDPASPGDPPGTEDYWICDENKHVITKAELLAAHADCRYFILNNAVEPDSNSRKYFASVTDISNSYVRLRFYMMQYDAQGVAEFYQKTVMADSEGRLYILSSYSATLAGVNQAVLVSEPQNFDSTQKAQGRSNIGAASASDVTALQSQVSSLSDVSAYSVKGEATVAQLNAGPSGIQAGWAYQLTDSGTLTDGSLAVVAGDTVAWDGTKWFPLVKSDYYATKTYAQNVAHSIAPEFDPTRNYVVGESCTYEGTAYIFTSNHPAGAWNPAHATISGQNALLQLTAQNSGIINKFYGVPFFHELVGYMRTDGTHNHDSGYHSLVTPKIPVSAGEKIRYRGRGGGSVASAIFYDSADAIVQAVGINNVAGDEKVLRESIITAPASTAYAIFCSYEPVANEVQFFVAFESSPLVIESDYDKMLRINSDQIKVNFSDGFLKSDGTLNTANTYSCAYTELLPVKVGQVFLYKGNSGSDAKGYVFFDSDLNVVSYGEVKSRTLYKKITIPSGVSFAIFSSTCAKSNLEGLYFDLCVLDSQRFKQQAVENYNAIASNNAKVYHSDGYLKEDFTFSTSTSYHCVYTDYIKVNPGQVIKAMLKGGTSSNTPVIALYFDANLDLVGYLRDNTKYLYEDITIPSGVSFAIFTSYHQAAKAIPFSLKVGNVDFDKIHDVLTDRVWYACGDSFTAGSSSLPNIAGGMYDDKRAVYPNLIGNRTQCIVHNIAVSGMTLAQPTDPDFTNIFTKDGGVLYTTDFSDADYITLYFGINDEAKSIRVGTIDDDDNTTFYGAWNVAIEYLVTNYPSVKIGIIVSNGCTSVNYPNAAKAIAEKWGLPYLDLDGGVNCQTMLRCSSRNPASSELKALRLAQQRLTSTDSHPNAMAHQMESTFIEAWIKSL